MRQAALPAHTFQWADASSYNLVGNEQAEPGFNADALCTGERRAFGFGALVGLGLGQADRYDLSFPYRPLSETLGVFAVGDLALPLAIGCGVGAVGIKKRIAAAQRAVAYHHDELVAAFDAVEHFHRDVVKAVSDHRPSRPHVL